MGGDDGAAERQTQPHAVSLAVQNGSKMRANSSSDKPAPLSFTATITPSVSGRYAGRHGGICGALSCTASQAFIKG